jgi:hypothetical protein
MMRRIAMVILAAGTLASGVRASADEMQPAVGRPDIMELGDPILINRKVLGLEMRRNTDLRDWIYLYGAPNYAEVQEIQIDPPWASYEVRLYYVRRNAYLAFGRVNVAPSVYDYGVRKYVGPIDPAVLDRLLTAQPAGTPMPVEQGPATVAPVAVVVETVPIEGVPVAN